MHPVVLYMTTKNHLFTVDTTLVILILISHIRQHVSTNDGHLTIVQYHQKCKYCSALKYVLNRLRCQYYNLYNRLYVACPSTTTNRDVIKCDTLATVLTFLRQY